MRTLALPQSVEHWSVTMLRDELVKIGAKVVRHGRYVTFQLTEVAVPRMLFVEILRAESRKACEYPFRPQRPASGIYRILPLMLRFTTHQARVTVVACSLVISGSLLLFLLLSPAIGMPFNYERGEHIRLIEVTIPVFFGYLGSSSHFIFSTSKSADLPIERQVLLFMLVVGPFSIFFLFIVTLFFAFYVQNQPPSTFGMSINQLSQWLSFALALLACTVGIVSGYLFGVQTTKSTPDEPAPPKSSGL